MSKTEQKVVAIQVAPFIRHKNAGIVEIEIQKEGADSRTKGYGVYLRLDNGQVKHADDKRYEYLAAEVAKKLCKEYGVPIELYGWQAPLVNA